MPTLESIRARAMMYLSEEVASHAAMTLAEMQQLVAGTYFPSDQQRTALARRMRLI
jgi:hypothetical protein